MRTRSLFSGIEGFGLGLTLAGLAPELVDVSEIDPFAQRVLRARVPGVELLADVREVDAGAPHAEILTAGFPCQPVSQAGLGLAQEDERWLWPEVKRIIVATSPELVIVENVRGLLRAGRGMGDVVRDLAEIGYGAQWDLIPALAVGARHLRHRVWIVAYPDDRPLGPIFNRPPWLFPFPPDPAELLGDDRVPRLVRGGANRGERVSALGNAVVPQVVASVAIQAIAARNLEPIHPPRLIPDAWPEAFPKAGALVAGHVFAMPTSVPEGLQRWAKQGLIPTATATDAVGSRRATARTDEWESSPGTTLTDYAWIEERPSEHWPEPLANGRQPRSDIARLREERRAPELWPTPKASPSGPDYARLNRERSGGDDLATAVAREESGLTRDVQASLFPTPSARDAKGPSGAGFLERRDGSPDLAAVAARSERGDDPGGQLNPRWVEWLMGYPDDWTDPESSTNLTLSGLR